MNKFFLLLLVVGTLATSCIPNKNLLYLKNTLEQDSVFIKKNQSEYALRVDDVLIVEVQGLDPNIAPLFNVINSNSQRVNKAVNDASLFLEGYTINPEGQIQLPVIGGVEVIGMTLEEATTTIQNKVEEYFINATAKVSLVNYRVTILGEVQRPGLYYNYSKRLSLFEALGMAGDLTEAGSRERIRLIRTTSEGQKIINLDISSQDIVSSEYFYIHPGDLIYVEPVKAGTQRFNLPVISIVLSSITTIFIGISLLR